MTWYLRSLGDHDTHHGSMRENGTVLARCGALFIPRPTLKVVGPPPGTLTTGDLALRGNPPGPDQVCPECSSGGGRPVTALGRAVHLLPATEVFWQGCPSTSVAVCGEPVASGPDREEEDPRYCAGCVRAALRWCAQPVNDDHG